MSHFWNGTLLAMSRSSGGTLVAVLVLSLWSLSLEFSMLVSEQQIDRHVMFRVLTSKVSAITLFSCARDPTEMISTQCVWREAPETVSDLPFYSGMSRRYEQGNVTFMVTHSFRKLTRKSINVGRCLDDANNLLSMCHTYSVQSRILELNIFCPSYP